ncbi:ATP-dependent nuclease [Streptomyces sp. NBC_01428]|uniref:ATP-dependent nuclease n=1 Tax=Streptomyces sp. NBC_01428 TaxID=2903861 RepID=UPI002E33FC13|nr:AAA family ATPase [Streptomyces sp. NBC_01428]
MTQTAPALPELTIHSNEVFTSNLEPNPEFITLNDWSIPVSFFVGRNGSGKSKTAHAIARRLGAEARILSTDRLAGLMSYSVYQWGSTPSAMKGIPIGETERQNMTNTMRDKGMGNDELYTLKEEPEVWLRVAAFLRRALGRVIELRESAGFLDPYVRVGNVEYSLLREEGHGLRELVILLAAAYRQDWQLLIVDEPELHLHPSMARLWVTELSMECERSGRRAIIVTHEPTLLKPKSADDLAAIWHFSAGQTPTQLSLHVLGAQKDRVTASLQGNPQLVSQLVFSPRPVLVEGPHDVAAFTVSLGRTQPPEVVAQTDLVECGGSGAVALWFEVCTKVGLDVKAVADLDACFAPEVRRAMDAIANVTEGYRNELAIDPPTTMNALKQLIAAMDAAKVNNDPKSRGAWLASAVPENSGNSVRKAKLLEIWRSAGLWLHPQGTLEDVLSIENKGVDQARMAAQKEGDIDEVTNWCAYSLDLMGDVFILLEAAVERIAHSVMESQRLEPEIALNSPVGPSSENDSRIVTVECVSEGRHRLTVHAPREFAGYWVEFSRDTPSSQLNLQAPREGNRA